jgi:hypothetical protein
MSGATPPLHQYVFTACCLVKPRDKFYLHTFMRIKMEDFLKKKDPK